MNKTHYYGVMLLAFALTIAICLMAFRPSPDLKAISDEYIQLIREDCLALGRRWTEVPDSHGGVTYTCHARETATR